MESEGQPVAPPPTTEAPPMTERAVETFRKLEEQAASERGDAPPTDAAG